MFASHEENRPPGSVHLCVEVAEELLPRFCLLTGGGFTVRAEAECSLRDLLCRQLAVASDYPEGRIQTIFLNGKAVDDPATTRVPAGSTIALSAAMPGIAGAMFRKHSPYAAMRTETSRPNPGARTEAPSPGRVTIKLFNAVQRELGPEMLRRGVRVPGKAIGDLLRGRREAFGRGILRRKSTGRAGPRTTRSGRRRRSAPRPCAGPRRGPLRRSPPAAR